MEMKQLNVFKKVFDLFIFIYFFIKALQLDPNNPQTHNELGTAFLSMNRQAEALVCFRRAITFDKKGVEARINLASLLNQQGCCFLF